jgi:Flp pilus assembly protein TadD
MKSADELFAEADRLEEAGDQHGALAVWRTLAERHPDPVALCRLGGLAKELGETGEAENAFRDAIKLDASLGAAYVRLAVIAIDKGEYQEAGNLLRQLLRIEKTEGGYCLLGVSLGNLGRQDEAEASYRAAGRVGMEAD